MTTDEYEAIGEEQAALGIEEEEEIDTEMEEEPETQAEGERRSIVRDSKDAYRPTTKMQYGTMEGERF